jgi:hypothetical protein
MVCVCACEVVVMVESKAKIDTITLYALIKDTCNIFGEGSSTLLQHNFTIGLSANQTMILLTHML